MPYATASFSSAAIASSVSEPSPRYRRDVATRLLNSKGISCLPKSEHGAGAGVTLFFTCVSAVAAPLAIGAVGDVFGHIIYGFWLATGFAVLLFVGAVMNWLVSPTQGVLEQHDAIGYNPRSAEGTV